ncbi:MAG: Aromatic/aminoadipate aminotransferase 1 [Caeruleum heppii]|nr:MAG: Aromatic/aminoadipate aminotransferase 1 [Caeruleum heppii]
MTPPPPTAVDLHAVCDTQSITLEDPLTVNNVSARRAKAQPLNGGVAASTHSDLFKSLQAHGKKHARRWDHRLNEESKSRQQPSIKGNAKYLSKPDLISLGGGLPSSDYFPFERLDFKVPSVGQFSEEETHKSGVTLSVGKHDVSEGKSAYDLSIALNYGQGTGSAQMLRWITEHTEIVHNPPYLDWCCTLTVGNTSALDMALRMFINRGDYILTEEYTFASALETALPMGVRAVGIEMDKEGLLPTSMDDILTNWNPAAYRGAPKPWLLYTVPSGQNPTGATQGIERRREIYRVAQKHDLYILEDEPYYFLQMQPYTSSPSATVEPPPKTHQDFINALMPSLLSMDTDGRVLRMDSFSKVISPGSRIGWITASAQIIQRFVHHNEVTIQNPGGFSQLILWKLLDESWGHAGYLDWLIYLRKQYTARRDVMVRACERYLPREIVSWEPPAAGMFLWLQIDWSKHATATSSSPDKAIADPRPAIENDLFHACVDRGVLLTPGSWFVAEAEDANEHGITSDVPSHVDNATNGHTNGHENGTSNGTVADPKKKRTKEKKMFFRATFASATPEKMETAIQRFGEAVREEFGIKP